MILAETLGGQVGKSLRDISPGGFSCFIAGVLVEAFRSLPIGIPPSGF